MPAALHDPAGFMDAGFEEAHPLGHIDGVVGQAFQIFGRHEEVQRVCQ